MRTLPDVGADWVGGHFELVELAVDRAARQQGVGRRLHDALLSGVTGRALLGTSNDDEAPRSGSIGRAVGRRSGCLTGTGR